jgi:hypothetical protein
LRPATRKSLSSSAQDQRSRCPYSLRPSLAFSLRAFPCSLRHLALTAPARSMASKITALLLTTLTCACGIRLSATLGDHAVLQRNAVKPPATIWGTGAGGTTVSVTFAGQKHLSTVNSTTGVWICALPPTPAGGPYTIVVNASDGSSVSLVDVLFGDVFFFGG